MSRKEGFPVDLLPCAFLIMRIVKTELMYFLFYLMFSTQFLQATPQIELHPEAENWMNANNITTEDSSEDEQVTSDTNSEGPQINNCSFEDICVRKCGLKGLIFRYSYGWVAAATLNVSEWMQPSDAQKNFFTLKFGFPPSRNATNETVCPIIMKDEFEFLENSGNLFYKVRKQRYSDDFFCMDSIYHEDGDVTEFAVICIEPIKKDKLDKLAESLHKIGLIISSLSLATILTIYVASPGKIEFQLQNKCIVSSCVNLLIALLLLIVNMTESITINLQYSICVTLGISIQFFFLSFYFWLNVMIYDISRVIRGSVKMMPLSSLEQKKKRYYYYATYAWGCPVVISTLTAIMQSLPKEANSLIIRPNIGEGRCWFKDGPGVYAYYYGIEITLHALNASLIIFSFYLLKGEIFLARFSGRRRESSQFKMRSHTKKKHISMFWQQFFTYILYVFVWILNVVTLIHPNARFWRVIDITVSLQGFFLLVIVIKFGNNIVKNMFENISKFARSLSPSSSSLSLRTKSIKLSENSNAAEDQNGEAK